MDWDDRLGLFREPEGPRSATRVLVLGLLVLGVYAYFLLVRSNSTPLLLGWAAMFFLAAIPHFLPRDRTTLAGVLRITAICYAVALVLYVIFLY